MPHSPNTGTCLVSIDLAASNGDAAWASDIATAGMEDLRDRLAAAGIPVTWGITPSQAGVCKHLLAGSVLSEIAVLAEVCGTSERSTRRQFTQGLAENLRPFQWEGFIPASLFLLNGRVTAHHDLLVKHGVQMVRVESRNDRHEVPGRRRTMSSSAPEAPWHALRWGLWQTPVTVRFAAGAERIVERAIRRLSCQGGTVILAAHARLLCESARVGSRLIEQLAVACETGVRFETFAGVAARLRTNPPRAGARSILHPAA